jgi:signal transduction histidine kinase/ligand-binding sensor domain-containing protein
MRTSRLRLGCVPALAGILALQGLALDPTRKVTQYIHRDWTQEDGLPQDTVRAITQTPDGYLWTGTEEGLARFDGYEFVPFNRRRGALPSNTVLGLDVSGDGTLWTATPSGLVSYSHGVFHTLTRAEGLTDLYIQSVSADQSKGSGKAWVVAGDAVCEVSGTGAHELIVEPKELSHKARIVRAGPDGALWIGGYLGIVRVDGARARIVVPLSKLHDIMPSSLLIDPDGTVWSGSQAGVTRFDPNTNSIRRYGTAEGLPDRLIRAMLRDRDGVLWVGTNGGLARFENGRFHAAVADPGAEQEWVRALYEDREGGLWVGTNSGLNCFHDGRFTVFSRLEGMPGDKPTVVHQTPEGAVWIGFHDRGLFRFSPGPRVHLTLKDGLPSNEIFSIRDLAGGGLLVSTRDGAVTLENNRIKILPDQDVLRRKIVFDALQDRDGRIWTAAPAGVSVIEDDRATRVAGGGPYLVDSIVRLAEARDGTIWAASFGSGLYEIRGGQVRHYTSADGLPTEQLRALYIGRDGTLWMGTYGEGLAWRSNGRFYHCSMAEGLPTDNIAAIMEDAGGDLWLSAPRGIYKVTRKSLEEFKSGRAKTVAAESFGVSEGLRSSQCAPSYPASGGGTRTFDGWLWFPTGNGLALLNPAAPAPPRLAPINNIAVAEFDGTPVRRNAVLKFGPGDGRMLLKFAGIHLRAPEAVHYSFQLEGVDRNWVDASQRRTAGYSNLRPGNYRFRLRAEAGGPVAESALLFTIRPHFYQTSWFAATCGASLLVLFWGAWQLRLQTLRARFRLVLEERARLARELHDTLAQDFVGLSTLLDAVSQRSATNPGEARAQLDLARKMVRHSLTEARRSVMDLRAAALQGQSLSEALQSAASMWVAGSGLNVVVDLQGEPCKLPDETEQHLVRVAQEALHNAAHHSHGRNVWLSLAYTEKEVVLSVRDDGRGFDMRGTFEPMAGHFGILGMQERAARVGATFRLESAPGEGTTVEIRVPCKAAVRQGKRPHAGMEHAHSREQGI